MLGEEDQFIIARAAGLAGIAPDVWLSSAIKIKANAEERARQAKVSLTAGPWEGWRTRDDNDKGWITHYGPAGEEMFYMPAGWSRRPWWKGPSSRPWSVRTMESMLLDGAGRIRTFATKDAAKAALDVSK